MNVQKERNQPSGRLELKWQVRSFAGHILEDSGDNEPLGSRWADRFIDQQKDVTMKGTCSPEAARAHASTCDLMQE